MPSITEHDQSSIHKYFPRPAGRPKGSKTKRDWISMRAELERVYKIMGGYQGLTVYAKEHPKDFYEMAVKVLAGFEVKELDRSDEPIRVVIYGKDEPKVIEASQVVDNASCSTPHEGALIEKDEKNSTK